MYRAGFCLLDFLLILFQKSSVLYIMERNEKILEVIFEEFIYSREAQRGKTIR